MHRYTLCILKSENEILLLNREKPPAMGLWNGVGGKIEIGETIESSVCREVFEETGYEVKNPIYKGEVILNGDHSVGMYLYLVDLPKAEKHDMVLKTREGILEWKNIKWVLDPENMGVIGNLKKYLPSALQESHPKIHTFNYSGHTLLNYNHEFIDGINYRNVNK